MQEPENLEHINIPKVIGIIPIKGGVIFPNLVAPIVVTKENLATLVHEAINSDKLVMVVAQKNPEKEEITEKDIYDTGTVCMILKMLRFPDGIMRLAVQGISRAKIKRIVSREPYIKAEIEIIKDKITRDIETEALMRNVVGLFRKLVALAPYLPDELGTLVLNIDSPDKLSDFVASYINVDVKVKQEFLSTADVKKRLQRMVQVLTKEIDVLELGQKIKDKVRDEMDKAQREYYLREQLKAIQKELGELGGKDSEIARLKEEVEKKNLPEEAKKVALKEIERLEMIPPASAEYTVVRTYLDWILALPWNESTEDNLDIKRAKKILDEDHYDLEKVKERILEFLAVRKLKKDTKGPILCFVGPPGVGKTSLGKSIARALGRKFVRLSLGGIRDEAEIRGHRRTYVGALPGRILQSLRRVGTNNPVFMLDEIDKVGVDFRGDPSAALLEILDPEQNHSFSDHYLEIPFDLSRVLFIATANLVDPIIPALKDRMEIIEIPGYVMEEKIEIARRYIIPRQIKENGLNEKDVTIEDGALKKIITEYTNEAGVRNLERQISAIMRKVARARAEGKRRKFKVTEKNIVKYLGPPKVYHETILKKPTPGVATGLAWTPTGGEILLIETLAIPGDKGLILTGSLGDVLKESAQAAISYIKSKSKKWDIEPKFFSENQIHIHIPQGAIPKDGPSAGVAIFSSVLSRAKNRGIDPHIAMTGEITLTGRVLPVGGIKEKILAAKRAGIKRIIMPIDNKNDFEEIKEEQRKGLDITFVKNLEEVYKIIFVDKK